MTPPLKGITLLHPWAWAIQKLGKDVENRSQPIGRMGGCVGMYLAIHGGVAPKPGGNQKWWEFDSQVRGLIRLLEGGGVTTKEQLLASGAVTEEHRLHMPAVIVPGIVAVARVSRCVQDHPSPWSVAGRWQFELADVLTLDEPIPHRGAQGLWVVEQDARARLVAAWKAARGGVCPFEEVQA